MLANANVYATNGIISASGASVSGTVTAGTVKATTLNVQNFSATGTVTASTLNVTNLSVDGVTLSSEGLTYLLGTSSITPSAGSLTLNNETKLNYCNSTTAATATLAVPTAGDWIGPEYHLIINGPLTVTIPSTLNSCPVYFNGDLLVSSASMTSAVTEELSVILAGGNYYIRTST